jgi:iron(III) transport system substrate-binding protein
VKHLKRRLVLPAILLAALVGSSLPAFADLKALEDAARKEGEVTWYVGSIDNRNAETAGKAFTAKYGVKVNVVRAASQIIYQRLSQDLSQKIANADVFSSVDIGNFVTLKNNKSLLQYKTETEAQLLEPFHNLDPDKFFHATVASVIVIAYNTDKVKGADIPRTWKDLLDPKWDGKLALGHPGFSGFAGTWAAQMQKLYGKAYLERIEKMRPQVSRSLQDAVGLLGSGERLVSPIPIAPIIESADKGNPLAIEYPSDGAIFVATPSGVLANAPHPNAAKLFLEFLQGPEFNQIMVKARYESMRADVKPLAGVKSVTDVKLIRPTIEDSVSGIPKVAELWRDIFGQ